MPEAEEKNQSSAGISPPEEVDVAALFARLREEVQRGGAPVIPDPEGAAALRRHYRAEAERLWPVSAERPFVSRTRLRAVLFRPAKTVLRRLMRWYVEPFAADQRAFNDAVLKLVDALGDALYDELDGAHRRLDGLSDRIDAASVRVDGVAERLERQGEQVGEELKRLGDRLRVLAELEERLTRLERRGSGPRTVAVQPAAAALPDYFAFESRMRGSTVEIRERQRAYVEDLRGAAPVLDLGCGRGELLGLLREAGIEARGVDADADMVAFARGEGLAVEQADAVAYLDGLADASLGGIFAAQLLEHLPPPALVRLLELAAAKLRPGGILVAETINPLSPLALRNYFADLTHAQPLVPETLVLLARQAGFAAVELRFLNEPPKEERLGPVELPPDPAFDGARAALAANVARLNELLYGPLDYAVVARVRA